MIEFYNPNQWQSYTPSWNRVSLLFPFLLLFFQSCCRFSSLAVVGYSDSDAHCSLSCQNNIWRRTILIVFIVQLEALSIQHLSMIVTSNLVFSSPSQSEVQSWLKNDGALKLLPTKEYDVSPTELGDKILCNCQTEGKKQCNCQAVDKMLCNCRVPDAQILLIDEIAPCFSFFAIGNIGRTEEMHCNCRAVEKMLCN